MEFDHLMFEDELVGFQQEGMLDPQQHMPDVRLGVTVGLLPEFDSQQVAQESLVDGEELIRRFEKFVGAFTQHTIAEVLYQLRRVYTTDF
jgi:hypothetical protein